jgi:hypothetical protein
MNKGIPMDDTSSAPVNDQYVSSQPPLDACTWCGLIMLCRACFADASVITARAVRENRKAA